MTALIVSHNRPVFLIGGGEVDNDAFDRALALCGQRVAADGGADAALARGVVPDAVIGDLDSLSPAARARIPAGRLHHIAEQDSTDFEKCLSRIDAPLVHATGFTGYRLDHTLAVLHVLAAHPARRVMLWGSHDVVTLAPPQISLTLDPGCRLSLFPLAEVSGTSTGLHWPIDGLRFRPDRQIGTSNRAVDGGVTLTLNAPAMLLILPVRTAPALQQALRAAPGWPAVPAR